MLMPSLCRSVWQSILDLATARCTRTRTALPRALRRRPSAADRPAGLGQQVAGAAQVLAQRVRAVRLLGGTKAGPNTRGGNSARNGSSSFNSSADGTPTAANSELLNTLWEWLKVRYWL